MTEADGPKLDAITDYRGSTLAEGYRVTGWRDGIPYTGTVGRILAQHPGCGGHRHIIVTRDDGSEIETFSDAVVVTSSSAS